MRPLDPVTSKQRAAYGFAFFVLFVALWAWATFGGYVSKTFLANPLTALQEGLELPTKHGFLFDIGRTTWRVISGSHRGAAWRSDGRLQADRGFSRAVRFVRPLSTRLGLHPAVDPVGGHRRTAEAAGDLYRLGVPDHPDDRGERRQHQARPR